MTENYSTYQIDPKITPDKAGEWKTPPEEDTWVLSHQSLRGEVDEIQTAIPNVVSDPVTWKITALKSMWKYHRDHVLAHNKAEEEVLQPMLATRFHYPEKVRMLIFVCLISFLKYRFLMSVFCRHQTGTRSLRRTWKS